MNKVILTLHSTMFPINQEITDEMYSDILFFTFHYVSY